MLNIVEDSTANNTDTSVSESVVKKRLRIWLDDHIEAGKRKPVAEVATLVPDLAALLLERNPVNRPIGRYNLEVLKADVASNRFVFNGESIVVSENGILLDGQHRCETVIATGIPIQTVIVFGPKEAARYTIDIGKPKSAANFLHMKEWKDTNNLAAAISLLLQYRKHGHINRGYTRPTKTEIINAADQFVGLQESLDFVHAATKKKLGSRSVLAFCHYVFWKRSSHASADEFMLAVIDGNGLRKGSPIYYCRERLLTMDRGARGDSRSELVFKCWNAWRRGENITSLKLSGKLPKVER